MESKTLKQLNTDALAYIGDSVYEVFVRERVLESGTVKAANLHRASTKYVKAKAQAEVIRTMFDSLTEEEQRLVKRARNHRYNSKAKNADPVTYKWATAFEALIGYLHLAGEEERLAWAMETAACIVEGTYNGTYNAEKDGSR